ncbi:MAG: hypothetical protein RSD36_16535 [Terrisporobacter sp.]
MKYYYRVYGLNIESTIEIPEFEIIDRDLGKNSHINIDVKLSYGVVKDEIKDAIEQGRVANYEKLDMWFYIKNLAIFHIYNGDTVVIEPCKDAELKMVKIYVMGSVLGMVLLQKNVVAIHGGGIVIDGKGCIFTGDKGAGKSTITTAFRKKGYKFISDDVCSIDVGEVNTINHGFGYQKICEDAMEKLGYNVDDYVPFRGDLNVNKYIVPAFDEFTKEDVPLEAVFELKVGDVDEVEIEEIIGAKKLKKIMKNIFRVEMIHYSGGAEPVYFKKCIDLAQNIQFYKITRPRDLFSVDQQIELIEEQVCNNNEVKLVKLG